MSCNFRAVPKGAEKEFSAAQKGLGLRRFADGGGRWRVERGRALYRPARRLQWMKRLVMRAQQIAAHHIEIACIDQAAIALDQGGAIGGVPARQGVPRHSRMHMMGKMEIVEKEKRTEQPRPLDDGRSPLDDALGAMLGEGAHERQRRARIGETHYIFDD